MEDAIEILSQAELARCTCAELRVMLHAIASELPRLAEGSADLHVAHAKLQAIRRALTRFEFRPC